MTFAPSTRRIYDRPVRSAIGLRVEFAPSPTSRPPRMRFVFLGPELCLQLPPRGSSRSYDCCSARGSRHSGPPGDFHPQVTSRLAFACRLKAPVTALRAMPGARTKPLCGGVAWETGRRISSLVQLQCRRSSEAESTGGTVRPEAVPAYPLAPGRYAENVGRAVGPHGVYLRPSARALLTCAASCWHERHRPRHPPERSP